MLGSEPVMNIFDPPWAIVKCLKWAIREKESDCNTINAMKLEFLLNIKEGRYMRLKACGIRKIKKGQHLVKKIMTRPSNKLRF